MQSRLTQSNDDVMDCEGGSHNDSDDSDDDGRGDPGPDTNIQFRRKSRANTKQLSHIKGKKYERCKAVSRIRCKCGEYRYSNPNAERACRKQNWFKHFRAELKTTLQ